MDTYAKAVEELKKLELQIANIAALQKRADELRRFIDIGRTLYPDGLELLQPPTKRESRWSVVSATSSVKDQIVGAAQRIIRERGPQQTVDLLRLLLEAGVPVGGTDKLLTVSVILSRAKDKFKSNRAAGGWTLVSPHEEETPQGALTPAGS